MPVTCRKGWETQACSIVSARTPRAAQPQYSPYRMEFLAYFWDDLDDVLGACRHVATSAITETLATAVPFIATTSGMLLACAAARLLGREHFAQLLG
ncbi:MAG: hypothetical protein PVS2B3_06500 [Steroidobacteraceae bacterium]